MLIAIACTAHQVRSAFTIDINMILHTALADLRGVRDAPPGGRILSFSSSFRQKISKIIPILELAHPPSGKSWIRHCTVYQTFVDFFKKSANYWEGQLAKMLEYQGCN